ncbi:2732_t:CDS:2 [Entrophospora sp. SA101]|nr:2732_t:CDS:2 [Entrophospora sp. SA101]
MSRNLLLENPPKKTQNEIITSLPSDIQLPFPPLIGASDFILKRSAEKIWMKSPNAFFIYRKAFQNHLKFLNYKLTMMNVSKLVSSCWKNEKVEVKDAYKKIAKEVEKQLKEKRKMDNGYPSW